MISEEIENIWKSLFWEERWFETVFKGLKIEIYLVKIFLEINNLENYLLIDGCL